MEPPRATSGPPLSGARQVRVRVQHLLHGRQGFALQELGLHAVQHRSPSLPAQPLPGEGADATDLDRPCVVKALLREVRCCNGPLSSVFGAEYRSGLAKKHLRGGRRALRAARPVAFPTVTEV